MSLLLSAGIDAAVLVSLGLLAAMALARSSAALRHAVLAVALLAAAAAPLLEMAVPQLPVLSWGAADVVTTSTLRLTSSPIPDEQAAVTAGAATPDSFPWPLAVATVWAAGASIILGGLLVGFVRLWRRASRSMPLTTGRWRALADEFGTASGLTRRVAVMQSQDPSLLVTYGLWRPKIILPAGAASWSDERRRVVLAHELAHITRHDWALQLVAETLRALYWFNPLLWVLCRRLRHESECACDDAVLNGGVTPTDYATHLLDVARQAIGQRTVWAAAPAIAHPSTLERRIAAMLTPRNRAPLTRRAWRLTFVVAIAAAVPIAAAGIVESPHRSAAGPSGPGDVALIGPIGRPSVDPRPEPAAGRTASPAAPVQLPPAALSGTIQDPSGAVLPGVELTLTDLGVGVRYTAVTDGTGAFAFPELPPARYELVTRLPGFASVSNVISLAAGANVQRRISLPIGSLEETITVGCAAGAAGFLRPAGVTEAAVERALAALARETTQAGRLYLTPVAELQAGAPVRVGGQIRPPAQTKKVNPVCPHPMAAGDEVRVDLIARVGVDGYLNDVRLADARDQAPVPPQEFVDSALEAVRQWTYTQTLLNNTPVEANIRVRVLYKRM